MFGLTRNGSPIVCTDPLAFIYAAIGVILMELVSGTPTEFVILNVTVAAVHFKHRNNARNMENRFFIF